MLLDDNYRNIATAAGVALGTVVADMKDLEALSDTELDLLEAAEFDMPVAGPELLGRDVAAICDAQILHQVDSVLTEESNRERLVIDMVQTSTYAETTPFVERIMTAFSRGFDAMAFRRRSTEQSDGSIS
jgi:predicted nucleotidyltransferase